MDTGTRIAALNALSVYEQGWRESIASPLRSGTRMYCADRDERTMKLTRERVRSLEQQETGETGGLRCIACGQRKFDSAGQLYRHEILCIRQDRTRESKTS